MKFPKQFLATFSTLALAAAMLAGCASAPPTPGPVLRLLFAKAYDDGCRAAYDAGDQLVIVSRARKFEGSSDATIYNRTNGLFLTARVAESYTPLGDTCTQQNPAKLLTSPIPVYVSQLSNKAARKIFDDRDGPPEALERLITAGAPYFRYNGDYEGIQMITSLPDKVAIKAPGSAFTVLSQFDVATVEAKGDASRAGVVKKTAEINALYRESKAQYAAAQAIWINRASAKYAIGDSVCTASNFIGNIEEITKERFKVFVIGRVPSVQAQFYSGLKSTTNFEKVDAPRWFDRSEVAHCDFSL